ncbi:hypothetical protein [uncultured Ornithinimicrobium sp.]|uniref:hypothetical protein n=1 Tax=uncultured Ornithinimicrobium sp. TaxID=259307 RepID=UPI002592186E|nr:hypothetical protein [uncultured Ornithinimicrobium sp.]
MTSQVQSISIDEFKPPELPFELGPRNTSSRRHEKRITPVTIANKGVQSINSHHNTSEDP